MVTLVVTLSPSKADPTPAPVAPVAPVAQAPVPTPARHATIEVELTDAQGRDVGFPHDQAKIAIDGKAMANDIVLRVELAPGDHQVVVSAPDRPDVTRIVAVGDKDEVVVIPVADPAPKPQPRPVVRPVTGRPVVKPPVAKTPPRPAGDDDDLMRPK